MKKKREAKRQAKQQEKEESNDGKDNAIQSIGDSIDSEKQLRIKKINSVSHHLLFLFSTILIITKQTSET